MLEPQWLIILVVICGLIFDFTNGWNDAANAIATVVATRVLTPLEAVCLAAFFNLIGPFFSTKVAHTVGAGLLDPSQVNQTLVLAALVAGITWNVLMTLMGLPISASHALVGGMVGAAVAKAGWGIVQFRGVGEVLVAMFLSPLLGGLFSYLIMKLLQVLVGNWPPTRVTKWFRKLQLFSVAAVAFTHGSGDAQKVMGIITLALLAGGFIPEFVVPKWVILCAASAIALGTLAGGWGVIKTVGMKMAKLQPVHGFAAETGAALFLALANFVEGVPVSSTHTITGSIIGVGLARRARSVRWTVAGKIVYAWLFTLPGCALVGWIMYRLLSLLV